MDYVYNEEVILKIAVFSIILASLYIVGKIGFWETMTRDREERKKRSYELMEEISLKNKVKMFLFMSMSFATLGTFYFTTLVGPDPEYFDWEFLVLGSVVYVSADLFMNWKLWEYWVPWMANWQYLVCGLCDLANIIIITLILGCVFTRGYSDFIPHILLGGGVILGISLVPSAMFYLASLEKEEKGGWMRRARDLKL